MPIRACSHGRQHTVQASEGRMVARIYGNGHDERKHRRAEQREAEERAKQLSRMRRELVRIFARCVVKNVELALHPIGNLKKDEGDAAYNSESDEPRLRGFANGNALRRQQIGHLNETETARLSFLPVRGLIESP